MWSFTGLLLGVHLGSLRGPLRAVTHRDLVVGFFMGYNFFCMGLLVMGLYQLALTCIHPDSFATTLVPIFHPT